MTIVTRVELGKIKSLKVGHGGYQDAMFGATFELGGEGWGVMDFWGAWSPSGIKHSEHCKWTESERQGQLAETATKLDALLKQAKESDVMRLQGKPVEVTLEGNCLKSWRLLTEVL